MVDQKIGPREMSQNLSAVITKCSKFSDYKLRQVLLQIAAANLLQNVNLYYENGEVLQTGQLKYKTRQVFQRGVFITQRGILVFLITLIIYFIKHFMRKLDNKKKSFSIIVRSKYMLSY